MAKATTRAKKPAQREITPLDRGKSARRELQQRIRIEKSIQALTRKLAREVRKSDWGLLDMAGSLMARAAAMEKTGRKSAPATEPVATEG